MKGLYTAFRLLLPSEKTSAFLILPLIVLNGFADMLGVAMVFPFLKLLGEPSLITTHPILSKAFEFGKFSTTESFIVFLGAAFLIVLILSAAVKIVTIYIANRWLEGRIHSLSKRLLTVYLRQPYEVIMQRNSSELVAVMLSETGRVVSQVFRAFSEFVMSLVTLVFVVALLIYMSPTITLAAIAAFAALYGTMLIAVRKISRRTGQTILDTNRTRHRIALEAVAGGKQVRLLNREASLVDSYSGPSIEFARANALSNTVRTAPKHIVESLALGGTLIMTLVLMTQSGGIGSTTMASITPMLGVFVLAIYRIMPAFQKGYNSYVSIRLTNASAELIEADLKSAENCPEISSVTVLPMPFKESIEFKDVSYRYAGAGQDGLSKINLKINRGMSVGIIGSTGAGKSTLMDLILGLLEPTEGSVLVDGKVLSRTELKGWRANVGCVQQDIFLSDASIGQNIAFGVPREKIDDVRLRRASKIAQIDDFISDLPEGYETVIGDRGVRLSGGQRQRISIARALYTEPEVIVFDEATSALDNATEDRLMAEVAGLAGERTLVMVAHRLTTVRDCDLIVLLEAGEIRSKGSYEQIVGDKNSRVSVVSGGL